MTQYDRLMSGKATAEEIKAEIKAKLVNKQLYRKLPGHVLVEEFLAPYFPADLSDLSRRTKIPYRRLQNLIRGQDKIDDRMAQQLGDFFCNGSKFWLDLQTKFESGEEL